MEALVGFAALAAVILILKWVGAWMLGVTNVLDKQDEAIKGMKRINENLLEIIEQLKK